MTVALLFIEHGQLFYLSYERVKLSGKSMEPHLWSYQQRISLEHLGQTLQEKKMREKYSILHDFLQVVCEVIYEANFAFLHPLIFPFRSLNSEPLSICLIL